MSSRAILSLLWARNANVLAHYLQQAPDTVVLTFGHFDSQAVRQVVESAGSRVERIESLLEDSDQTQIHDAVNQQLRLAQDYLASEAWSQQAAALDIETERLTPLLHSRMNLEVPALIVLLQALEVARQRYQIDLLVVSEDMLPVAKSAVLWARKHAIPSLHLLHGVALARPYTVHEQLTADMLAVFGPRSAEGYLDLGLTPDRIKFTGNPAWDHYPSIRPQRLELRRHVVQKYGLNPALPIVVFATTWAANLTAVADEQIFGRSVVSFLGLVSQLRQQGIQFNAVIKDRAANRDLGLERINQLLSSSGAMQDVVYAVEDAEAWVVGADAVIGVDSNILVEAMMVGTPAINLLTDVGMRLGPSFDAESGVIEVDAAELESVLPRLLLDPRYRQQISDTLLAQVPRYNIGVDGQSASRVAQLMLEMVGSRQNQKQYLWQQCLDVSDMDASGYHEAAKTHLVDMFHNEPKVVIDIGCAAGATGALIKQRYPQSRVWGFELNKAAAKIASGRLDKVLVGKFEDFDLELEGLPRGSVDGVILADVLEHMYNPWQVMVKLRPYLSAKAQVIVSIPNVRNLALMDDLAKGNWRYDSWGLLDITHIRFFTYVELLKFFSETGYRVNKTIYGIDDRLRSLFEQYKDVCPTNIDTEKMVLKNVSSTELHELCSLQFYLEVVPEQQSQAVGHQPPVLQGFDKYVAEHQLSEQEAQQFELRMAQWQQHPRFHFVVVALDAPMELVIKTIKAFTSQYYHNVSMTLLSDFVAPTDFNGGDRIRWQQRQGTLFDEINIAWRAVDADWTGIVAAGDGVVPHALLMVGEAIHCHPDWQVIYGDEAAIDPNGRVSDPLFKPDFSLEYLRALPYPGSFVLFNTSLLTQLSGFDSGYAGNEIYDAMLRAYELLGAAAIGHVPEVLFLRSMLKRYDALPTAQLVESGQRAVSAHLQRQGVAATVQPGLMPGSYRVRYAAPDQPLVSIIIPTKDKAPLLQRCLETLTSRTDYRNYEILVVDNGSTASDAVALLDQLIGLESPSLRVYRYPGDFHFGRINNLVAQEAQGELLLFLNNDTAPLNADWLDELVGLISQSDVGVVGARLLFPDGKVQQAGLTLGLLGAAETPFLGYSSEASGYLGRALVAQDVSAVSGSCILIRKPLLTLLKGFDEHYTVAYGDVDLCLRAREAGFRVVWTPHASLLHDAGASLRDPVVAGSAPQQIASDQLTLLRQHLPALARDPFYSPNLALTETGCQVETRKPLTWNPLSWKPLPRILAHPGDNMGCGHYRVIEPLSAASRAGKVEAAFSFGYFSPVEMERFEIDTWYLQRQFMPNQRDMLKYYKEMHSCRVVFELDDLITNLPEKNAHRGNIPAEVGGWLKDALDLCDRFVVTTDYLADQYRHLIKDVKVVPNTIYGAKWMDLQPLRRTAAKPRVGWGGGISHTGDLELIIAVVKELANEVDWVFFGMCPDVLRPYIREFHPGVATEHYPAKLASLNLDLAIAPLEEHPFNMAKSSLRLLEYGVLGYPVICTDILPYQGAFPVTRVSNHTVQWVKAIREHIHDLDSAAKAGDALRQHVLQHHLLENNLEPWMQAWFDN